MINRNFIGGVLLEFYGEQNGFSEDKRETVYHAGNGFYSPYIEPLWMKEKRTLQNTANGIGLAAHGGSGNGNRTVLLCGNNTVLIYGSNLLITGLPGGYIIGSRRSKLTV